MCPCHSRVAWLSRTPRESTVRCPPPTPTPKLYLGLEICLVVRAGCRHALATDLVLGWLASPAVQALWCYLPLSPPDSRAPCGRLSLRGKGFNGDPEAVTPSAPDGEKLLY